MTSPRSPSSQDRGRQPQGRRRVPALAPEERRAAIVAATVPLLRDHGPDVSTRQIAAAAGVAEGTLFGVFRDKDSLIAAALMAALDPRPALAALDAVDMSADLRERMRQAADLVHARFLAGAPLMHAARRYITPQWPEVRQQLIEARRGQLAALTRLIEPDAPLLRRSAGDTARLLLLFCGADTHGPYGDPARFDAAEIVSLLLDGLLIVPGGGRPAVTPPAHERGVE
ncbi:TetR/AcrR family transcriptional regulator [Mangrovihabitans endophyticus]|uniref:TetR/AcrR family transcriptional regulator n=1 Tax=Mangrovihabitans endophyticus TaxID=1751298 RepID=UPI001E4A13ED|nr:TetR/AcrR family transcriptional regulator [Mangrovihabitans endophyticus]